MSEAADPKMIFDASKASRSRSLTLRRVVFTVVLTIGAHLGSEFHPAFAQTSLVHKHAPEFTRTDLNHQRLDLKRYRGKVVLLNFWATWCAPCQLEIPRFVAWQSKYGPRGLQIIGISMDDDPALARKAYDKLKFNYPVAMGDEQLGELYGGVLGLPVTYLIDSRGRIRAKYQGETNLDAIEKELQSLLPSR